MPTIQAVAFDLDGLMFNTEELYQHVGGVLLRRRGKEFTPELLDQMMGRQAPVALQIMIDWHQLDATVDDLKRETMGVFEEILDDRLRPMPGLVELLQFLDENQIPRSVATSSTRQFVDRVLSMYDWPGQFKFILAAEDVAHGKPHPEIYLRAAELFGVKPQQMLVLEDSQNGCQAGVAAKALTVAVPSGHSLTHNFTGAFAVAGSLADPKIYDLFKQ
ncbi:MAG: HAD family phosphatase [Pirellulaceae bacterium]|nr:HAD family phosphatase [Pirellulaceae bacterium]